MKRVSAEQRRQVAARARGYCEYCLTPEKYSPDSFSIEHIVPGSAGGETTTANLAFSCQGCNNRKYNKTEGRDPVTDAVIPLYNPRKEQWEDSFAWSEGLLYVIGMTPTGRATVEMLKLNREGIVNLRRILYSVGEHPPAKPNTG